MWGGCPEWLGIKVGTNGLPLLSALLRSIGHARSTVQIVMAVRYGPDYAGFLGESASMGTMLQQFGSPLLGRSYSGAGVSMEHAVDGFASLWAAANLQLLECSLLFSAQTTLVRYEDFFTSSRERRKANIEALRKRLGCERARG